MIWQKELLPLPESLGKRLVLKAGELGSSQARELATIWEEDSPDDV